MQPTRARNHSGILLQYKQENILFDCGEGIQRQMRIAGIKPAKITRICLSHWHGDHVLGLPGLLSTMGADNAGKKVYIYGPKGTKQYVERMFSWFAGKDIIDHDVKEVSKGVFLTNEEFCLEAQPLNHSAPCVGYSFVEHDRRRIDVGKINALKLEGPVVGKLQRGEDILVNKKKIRAGDVTYVVPGKKVGYIADTVPCNGADALAKDADLLISEGTHLDDIKEKTAKFKHLTVKQAALIASENNARKLVITHISQRYKASSEVLAEAREYFPNSVVAEDFMKIMV